MTNMIKTTALVAALGLGTAVAAEGSFGFQTQVESDSSIMIDLVRTSSDGTLAVYDYSTGEFGELLGTVDLIAGANPDVLVTLAPNTASTVAAVIYEGEVMTPDMGSGWVELDISDES